MHPVIQRLLHVKWNLFGKWGTIGLVAVNLFYTLIWTVLGILLPRHGESYYTPLSSNWWRLLLEIIGLLLTAYFIYTVSIKHFFLRYFLSLHCDCTHACFVNAVILQVEYKPLFHFARLSDISVHNKFEYSPKGIFSIVMHRRGTKFHCL